MKSTPYVLARGFSEGHHFARETLGLAHGHYRVITSASTIKSVRGADLHLAPGWDKRFDGFTIRGALRWTRMNVIDHSAEAPDETAGKVLALPSDLEVPEWLVLPEAPLAEPDGLTPAGVQLDLSESDPEGASVVDLFTKIATGISREEVAEVVEEAQAQHEETKRRRRRCKDCGILVDPDDVDSHAADHANDLLSGE